MKVKGQKLKICAKKARAANKRRVAFFPKIATRWIYFVHIFRQLLVPNLSKAEKKVLCSRLSLITFTLTITKSLISALDFWQIQLLYEEKSKLSKG